MLDDVQDPLQDCLRANDVLPTVHTMKVELLSLTSESFFVSTAARVDRTTKGLK